MNTAESSLIVSTKPTEVPFDFAKSNFEIDINVSTDPEKEKLVSARMRRAEKEELLKRERESTYEIREVSATENEPFSDDSKANGRLFDKVVTEVRGFRLRNESKELSREFRTPSPELLAEIPGTYKGTFVESMYIIDATFIDDDEDVVLGDTLMPVDFFIGYKEDPHAVIRFEIPQPEEDERLKFGRKAASVRQPKGSRKTRNKIITNLNASVDFFVDLMSRPGASISDNGKVNGVSFKDCTDKVAWLNQVDPIYMSVIISAAMSKYNSKVQD